MAVRNKIIRAAREARTTSAIVRRPQARKTLLERAGAGAGRRQARQVARRMSPQVGRGTRSSRYLAAGLAVAYGGGAVMNRRGPAADRVQGIRNTGMYQF